MNTVLVEGLTKTEAEEFMDWLENNECPSWELLWPSPETPYLPTDGGFSVKFQGISQRY